MKTFWQIGREDEHGRLGDRSHRRPGQRRWVRASACRRSPRLGHEARPACQPQEPCINLPPAAPCPTGRTRPAAALLASAQRPCVRSSRAAGVHAPEPRSPAPAAAAAATPPDAAPARRPPRPGADPVVATVNRAQIHLSDVAAAGAEPAAERCAHAAEQMLYPDAARPVDRPRRAGRRGAAGPGSTRTRRSSARCSWPSDAALQRAFLIKRGQPQITDEAVHARYEKDIAEQAAGEEVHASHILVDSEAQAKDDHRRSSKGRRFRRPWRRNTARTAGGAQGGDLGFFKKADMVPEFADAAFALQARPVLQDAGAHPVRLARHQGRANAARTSRRPSTGARTSCASIWPRKRVEKSLPRPRRTSRSRSSTSTARRSPRPRRRRRRRRRPRSNRSPPPPRSGS